MCQSMGKGTSLGTIIAILVFTINAPAAFATLPMAQPSQYSAYGPVQLCSEKFIIDVKNNEALDIVGDIVRVISDREILAVKLANDRYWVATKHSPMKSAKIEPFSATLFSGLTPDERQTVTFAPHGLRVEDIRYALSIDDGGAMLIVGATSFTGGSDDRRLLDRIRPASEQKNDCLSLELITDNFADDGGAAWVKPNDFGWANIYPQTPVHGPAFHCMGGVGFAVEADETIRRPWASLGSGGPVQVESHGSTIRIDGREDPIRRIDASDSNEHPMGLLHKSEIIYYPSRGVGPPYSPEGLRELGSWNVVFSANRRPRPLEISFPASQKSGAGFNFLERLRFVEDDDPRCGKDGARG